MEEEEKGVDCCVNVDRPLLAEHLDTHYVVPPPVTSVGLFAPINSELHFEMYGGKTRVNLRIKRPLLISDFNKNWIMSTNKIKSVSKFVKIHVAVLQLQNPKLLSLYVAAFAVLGCCAAGLRDP